MYQVNQEKKLSKSCWASGCATPKCGEYFKLKGFEKMEFEKTVEVSPINHCWFNVEEGKSFPQLLGVPDWVLQLDFLKAYKLL